MDPSAHLAQAPATQEAAFAERRAIEALDRIATLFPFEETKHGRVLTLGTDELFDSGSATLTPTAMNRLEDLTSALRHVVSHRIQIRCFTDSLGSAAENLELSRRRAVALKDFLVSHGVDISLLDAMGEGAKHPLSDNATASGRATNRRIEITIEKTRAHVPSPVSQLS
jgi:outer membrane protein OmpA-like peptidoglycan-associated protein